MLKWIKKTTTLIDKDETKKYLKIFAARYNFLSAFNGIAWCILQIHSKKKTFSKIKKVMQRKLNKFNFKKISLQELWESDILLISVWRTEWFVEPLKVWNHRICSGICKNRMLIQLAAVSVKKIFNYQYGNMCYLYQLLMLKW